MPVSYRIDIARRLVFTSGYSTVTDRELLQHNIDLKADSNFDPTFNQLLYFRDVTLVDVKPETINYIAEHRIFDLSSRRAIVVKPGLQYGFARMFKSLRQSEDKNIEVFLDLAEALNWLGLSRS